MNCKKLEVVCQIHVCSKFSSLKSKDYRSMIKNSRIEPEHMESTCSLQLNTEGQCFLKDSKNNQE